MTATAIDRMDVPAATEADARDVARWRWEPFGLRVVRVLDVELAPRCIVVTGGLSMWRVTAEVEVVRE